jgi:hypothetical protein
MNHSPFWESRALRPGEGRYGTGKRLTSWRTETLPGRSYVETDSPMDDILGGCRLFVRSVFRTLWLDHLR